MAENNFPKLHNASWPGVVGKGSDSESVIPLEQMFSMTAAAEVNGIRFDGIDAALIHPEVAEAGMEGGIDLLAQLAKKYNLKIGSLVAAVWPPTGGSAMGSREDRARFVEEVRKACVYGKKLRDMGIRPYGVIRIDSATNPQSWSEDPVNNTKLIAQTFREACDVATQYGEKLAAEGEICWGGMHSWRAMVKTLESVDRPNIGFQADMSHTLLYLLGYNSPEDRILPEDFQWSDREALTEGLKKITHALRPWTIDFHVAQNDGTVHGTGSHDKTGRHCLATDPNGKLDVVHDAGYWLRDDQGKLTKAFRHICWDGCMFPNEVMTQQKTWNDILDLLVKIRKLHGWYEAD